MGIFNDNLPGTGIGRLYGRNADQRRFYRVVYERRRFFARDFDFDADSKLRDFKIYYRLWFYDYRYDDLELGIKRQDKLINDIKRYFIEDTGISGLDYSLRKE